MSAAKQTLLFRRRVHNPALGVPLPSLVMSRQDRERLAASRRPVCQKCPFYALRNGHDRCMHVDRECELLGLGRPRETCPINAWKETT